jgi:hypothetical protein
MTALAARRRRPIPPRARARKRRRDEAEISPALARQRARKRINSRAWRLREKEKRSKLGKILYPPIEDDGEILDALYRFCGLGEHEGGNQEAVGAALRRLINHGIESLRCQAARRRLAPRSDQWVQMM